MIKLEEAKKIVRKVIASHAGEMEFPENLFNDSVKQLMEEANKSESVKEAGWGGESVEASIVTRTVI